ncbi:NADPH-dependent thioredoxin reductase 3 [Zea mays]|nr:NADPH-dependent thioredoxin reductase 3 [Zea mays]ONM60313.1 NADPH-dependent thioredoxin reductase 3 [Zea mays]ONM60319.1 NADPH-dependent thioredoxin reductase 3 [Zea mays]
MICSLCKHTVECGFGIFIQAYNAPKGCSSANTVSLNCLKSIFLNIRMCGNRTEYCQSCRKYIRLREWIGHELQFHTILNAASQLR